MPRKKAAAPASKLKEHDSVPDRDASQAQTDAFHRHHAKLKLPPVVYGRELEVIDLVPEQPGLIVLIQNFLSVRECADIIQIIDSVGLNEASPKDTHPRKGEAYLNRENATFQDAKEKLCFRDWPRVCQVLMANMPLGCFSV
eukprot:m.88272 g.88272  ORF g.88272 m.88272 type:complete len:142 (-) comp14820_c0_seq2:1901-2326(-)